MMRLKSAFSGGFSIAREGAIGAVPVAKHMNTETAAEISNLGAVNQNAIFVLGALAIMVIVPVVLYSNAVRKRMRPESRP